MADIKVNSTKVFTIPANEETSLIFNNIQHVTIRNLTLLDKIFFRHDGQNAVLGSNECYYLDAIVAGLEIYTKNYFNKISLITAREQQIMIINAY